LCRDPRSVTPTTMTTHPPEITFGEMRASSVRDVSWCIAVHASASRRFGNERDRGNFRDLVVTIWHLVPGSQVGSGGR
jgi:hypothetical protein